MRLRKSYGCCVTHKAGRQLRRIDFAMLWGTPPYEHLLVPLVARISMFVFQTVLLCDEYSTCYRSEGQNLHQRRRTLTAFSQTCSHALAATP